MMIITKKAIIFVWQYFIGPLYKGKRKGGIFDTYMRH